MSLYKFTHTDPKNHPDYKLEMQLGGDMHRDEIIREFGFFLKACGFDIDGELEIVADD